MYVRGIALSSAHRMTVAIQRIITCSTSRTLFGSTGLNRSRDTHRALLVPSIPLDTRCWRSNPPPPAASKHAPRAGHRCRLSLGGPRFQLGLSQMLRDTVAGSTPAHHPGIHPSIHLTLSRPRAPEPYHGSAPSARLERIPPPFQAACEHGTIPHVRFCCFHK